MLDAEQKALDDRWIGAALFPVVSVAALVGGVAVGIRAIRSGQYHDLLLAVFLLGGSWYMLRLVYRSTVGGATFADRMLRGFMISGFLFIFFGLSVFAFGWTKMNGPVPRSEGIFPTALGIALVLVSSVLKLLRRRWKERNPTSD